MSIILADTFKVPTDFDGVLPCTQKPAVFASPALDADPYDEDFRALNRDEQQEALAAKQIAEQAAVAVCGGCPLLAQCREWALTVNVHGVAGGTTHTERRTATGWQPAPQTSTTAPRTAPASTTAQKPLDPTRLTTETRAIYDYLAEHGTVTRDAVVAAVEHHVDDDTAERWGKHVHTGPDDARAAGRRKFMLNRIDLAVRRGRIIATRTHDGVILTLAPSVQPLFAA